MARKYFGTDGVRGRANSGAMTADMVLKIGMAAGNLYRRGSHRHRVVIGKDTRLSGYMIENALTSGLLAAGMDVFLFGPVPTPAVSMLTRSMRADLGIMISASHNPFADNGIKIFGPDGFKLSDEQELEIERMLDDSSLMSVAEPDTIGRAKRIEDAQARYIEFAKRTYPKDMTLDGLRVVIDTANGAAYKVAPTALWELGAEVIQIGNEPNGININDGCGSTHPEAMCAKVKELRADIGIALDGDADRVIIADDKGQVVDGDQLMALIATSWAKRGELRGGGLVATIMSNLGLERYLAGQKLTLARTKVGDRYVVEHMRAHGHNVGGEQSGHIVLSDFSTTGDGLLAALQVLAEVKRQGKPVSEVCNLFTPLPQVLKNVKFKQGQPLEDNAVRAMIADAEARLGNSGRLVIRPSGTEPVIRVMAEGDDEGLVVRIVDELCGAIARAAA
ncbi:phosphoglucosamine mutase [Aestuariivirga litoralis]|uniref:Phosphoglucosamine mutase n=1 Tax=Aestuariivirga litoralis TaxID=2650924 RepID=A0A2W2BS74_9HYPH|nr:phosphoglucosamine mutase [Aestuariivirga litoralis]PZF78537.1 phosphoglucosamine mutase [Aestuariivirga litoralis]